MSLHKSPFKYTCSIFSSGTGSVVARSSIPVGLQFTTVVQHHYNSYTYTSTESHHVSTDSGTHSTRSPSSIERCWWARDKVCIPYENSSNNIRINNNNIAIGKQPHRQSSAYHSLRVLAVTGGGKGNGPFQSTLVRHVKMQKFFKTEYNFFTLNNVFTYIAFSFIVSMLYVTVFAANEIMSVQNKKISKKEKENLEHINDPRRIPWPLLHERVVFMREGKTNHEDIGPLWEQCKEFYPHDWLIPLEIGQILKYTSGVFLQAYVADPEQLRREVIFQLLNVRNGNIPDRITHKVSADVKEIINIAVAELEGFSLDPALGAPLVPSQSRGVQ